MSKRTSNINLIIVERLLLAEAADLGVPASRQLSGVHRR
jgi:hypothetical protein